MFEKLKNSLYDWVTHEEPYTSVPLCDFERILYEIRPCDVLLIEGRSRVSRVINQVTQSPWTHSCLYIGRLHDVDDEELRKNVNSHYDGKPNDQLIIEGYLGKGTICENLEIYRNYHIRICRPRGLSRKDAQKVMRYAINKLGAKYDVRQIYDMWRFFLPWTILPRRWRSTLFEGNQNSSAKAVCSSMIAEAFGEVNFPILPLVKQHEESGLELVQRNPRLISPKDFDYSPYFEIIKYPFIGFSERGYYHDLPWNREGMIISEAPSQYSTEVTDSSIIQTENQSTSIDEEDESSSGSKPKTSNKSKIKIESNIDSKKDILKDKLEQKGEIVEVKDINEQKNNIKKNVEDTASENSSDKNAKSTNPKFTPQNKVLKLSKDFIDNFPTKKLSAKLYTKKDNI